jgi:hypothetical protein
MYPLEVFGLLFVISFMIGVLMALIGANGFLHSDKRKLPWGDGDEDERRSKKRISSRGVLTVVVTSIIISGLAELAGVFTFTAMFLLIWVTIGSSLLVFTVMGVAFGVDGRHIKWPTGVKIFVVVAMVVFLILGVGAYGGLGTATHYNNDLTVVPGSTLFANDVLPYDEIPIVSEQYASYIVTSHLSDFGGNVRITDYEMIVYNGSPYWIFSIAPTNVFAVNHLVGFVLVNAVNANYTEIFQKTWAGNGLWFLSNVDLHAYLSNEQYSVGNQYPQPAPDGQVDYVVTFNSYNAMGVMSFGGGVVYNPQGKLVAQWTNISNAPSWVNQPWDKYFMDSVISTWANSRTGNNSFGFFAGGFIWIKASPWMMSVDNISELIPYHGSAAYMQFLSPASNPNGLAGVMLATGGHIYFYNMEGMSMISATAARATIQAKLPALSGATYFTANPVLYPVGKYYAWVVPYYSQESSTGIVQLQGRWNS